MSDINYSIIIPHKNIPHLLQRCLDSIPRREDIQIIIVDDNSDSERVDFNHFPGAGDPRIEVYLTKEGKGAGYARNVGLRYAKGKWLLFADADDYYTKNAWPLLDQYLHVNVDIIYFGVDCVDSNTLLPASRNLKNNAIITSFLKNENNSETLLRYTCWEPWNKMWNKNFVLKNNLYFDEIPRGNDAMFVLKGGDKAYKIEAIDKPIYTVTYRSQSISHALTKETLISSLLLKIRINRFYNVRRLNYLKQSVLYDVKQAYCLFGLKFAIKEVFLIYKNHGDFFNSLVCDTKAWKRLIKRFFYGYNN